eukprot:1155520-Pelagomonas_calceolata.AAC.1
MGTYFPDAVGFSLEGCDRKGESMKYCVVIYEGKEKETEGNKALHALHFWGASGVVLLSAWKGYKGYKGTDVAQWLWNYRQSKAAGLSAVQASNTTFRYDHVTNLGLATSQEV